ncbi:hypothetical protein ACS0TY_011966 [Phlomoides rotata]
MSVYDNVGGKLRLKGEALNVRDGGAKKRKKHKERHIPSSLAVQFTDENVASLSYDVRNGEVINEDDQLTPAERRYLERRQKIELERLAKAAKKSHRDRIQEFNQYLANLSEHYDIPKVGPG